MEGKQLMYIAMLSQCKAEKAEAIFTIDNYMKKSVGIGEHPQQVEEAMKALEKLAAANDKIDNLRKYFGTKQSNPEAIPETDVATNFLDLEALARKMDDFLKIVTEGK